MPKFRLFWPVDMKGYKLVPGHPARKRHRDDSKLERLPTPATLVPLGGQKGWYDCMERAALYHRLTDFPATQKGALAFANEYGFLRAGNIQHVDSVYGHMKLVQQLIDYKKNHDWDRLRDWLDENGEVIRLHPEVLPDEQLMTLKGNRKVVRLYPERLASDPPQIFFRPGSLLDAIYLQFFEDLSSGAKIKKCASKGCKEWFAYGTGTDRRSTAQFCSQRCQQAVKYVTMKKDGRR